MSGFNPDAIQEHRVCDKFDDELMCIWRALTKLPAVLRLDCSNWQLVDGKLDGNLTITIRIVAAPGEVEHRLDLAACEIINALPMNQHCKCLKNK